MSLIIPSEGIGSIPRPIDLIEALKSGNTDLIHEQQEIALKDTLNTLLDITKGEYPITDGEQTKSSFVTYPLYGKTDLLPDGATISFSDGHTRQLPVITKGPFEYGAYAIDFYNRAKALVPPGTKIKQAVIAPSAISLLYPSTPIPGYTRDEFIHDIVRCSTHDIRSLLNAGADSVQIDFTEGRLALKFDPSGGLLQNFLDIIEKVLQAFTDTERQRIGIHSCPGADQDCTHSADVPYDKLLPSLFKLSAYRFYLQMKSELEPEKALEIIQHVIQPHQLVFIGVTDVNNASIESPDEIASFIERVSQYIPISQLGTTDDCGFSPFADDQSTSRDIAFAKIRARIEGTKLASQKLLP